MSHSSRLASISGGTFCPRSRASSRKWAAYTVGNSAVCGDDDHSPKPPESFSRLCNMDSVPAIGCGSRVLTAPNSGREASEHRGESFADQLLGAGIRIRIEIGHQSFAPNQRERGNGSFDRPALRIEIAFERHGCVWAVEPPER